VIDTNLIASKANVLIDPKFFYGYTAGITFFIAVFATNLFDQGVWQRVFAAQSTQDLKKGFKNSFFIVLPVILLLGFCGIVAVSLGQAKDPSTIIFSLLLTNGGKFLTISILILALTLVISSMDTLINAISSLIIIDGNKIMPFQSKLNYFYFSKFFLIGLSILVFYIASKGLSVLYMFLLADLLCCAAVFPIFYGMFKQDINSKIALLSVAVGLVGGLLFFPNLTFEKSILVGLIFESSLFPTWISTALLFWSFVVATILPLLTLLMLRKKNITYNFTKIKNSILEIK